MSRPPLAGDAGSIRDSKITSGPVFNIGRPK